MSRFDLAASIVSEFCADMGLDGIRPNADGRLTLDFGDVPVTFAFSADPVEVLWLHAGLGSIPAEGLAAPKFLMHLASACWTRNRMTVGLDANGQTVWGYTCIPAAKLNKQSLEQTLTALLEAAVPASVQLARQDFDLTSSEHIDPEAAKALTRR